MISDFIALLRKSARSLLSGSSPDQLATGFTLGMIIGVMPKSNLIALSLCVLLFSLRCNKGFAIIAAIAFSFVTPWTDPFAHKLGLAVLGIGSFQATYASLLNMPLGPWLGFNNTVVAGSLLTGVYIAYPVHWMMRMLFKGIQSIFTRKPGARLGFDAELQPRAAA
jgi:uncharacterized protein (TIGR03546 family)